MHAVLSWGRVAKSANGGVGLGLSTVKAILHGHSGELYLANLPDGGLLARATPAAMTSEQVLRSLLVIIATTTQRRREDRQEGAWR